MRAELSSDGCLMISSQSDVEAYALSKWYEDWGNKSALHVSFKSHDFRPTFEVVCPKCSGAGNAGLANANS